MNENNQPQSQQTTEQGKKEWRTVRGFDMYEISNYGEVISLHRGKRKHKVTNRISKKTSYIAVALYKDGRPHGKFVHRLVAEAFIPNPDNKPQVNHKNGIKSDNRVENLEWCTQSENNVHALKTGLRVPGCGEDNSFARLTSEQVDYIRKNYKPYVNGGAKIGRMFGVPAATIKSVIQNKSWKNHGNK